MSVVRRPRFVVMLGSVLAILVAGAGDAVAQEMPGDSVSLRFGWNAGMSARVEQEWIRIQKTPERRDSSHVRSVYRMRVREHPEGLLIENDSFRVLNAGQPGAAHASDDILDEVSTQIETLVPSFVVNGEGDFLRIHDIDAFLEALEPLLRPMRQDLAGSPPEVHALFAQATSPEVLNASAAEGWNLIVGTWAGADWEIGELYVHSQEEPTPLMPGLNILMSHEFIADERLPCTKEETEFRCVRLEMVTAPDSAGLRNFVAELMAMAAPAQRQMIEMLRDMRSINEITVITDPATLRPYSLEYVKHVEVNVRERDDEPVQTTVRTDIRRSRYQYDP